MWPISGGGQTERKEDDGRSNLVADNVERGMGGLGEREGTRWLKEKRWRRA